MGRSIAGFFLALLAGGAIMIGIPLTIAANMPPPNYQEELAKLGFTSISVAGGDHSKELVATAWVDRCQIKLTRRSDGHTGPKWLPHSTSGWPGGYRHRSLSADEVRKNEIYFQRCVKTSPPSPTASVAAPTS